MEPPFKCLFCLSSKEPFYRVEHPIPESLGNNDLFLDPGFVCDPCNQYFGSKIEQKVLNSPPFSIERIAAAVKTKKGKLPKVQYNGDLSLFSTGYKDGIIFATSPSEYLGIDAKHFLYDKVGNIILNISPNSRDDFYTVRLLLKMGLELLLCINDINPYDPIFDKARNYARYASPGTLWEMGYALYARREDLIISQRVDEHGPLITHQLYQYEFGRMFSGDFGFCFVYRQHVFACNLSSPSLTEYVVGFNSRNQMRMTQVIVKK